LLVLPSLEPQRSMASTTFIPSLTRPKTTCLPSNLQEKHQSPWASSIPTQGPRLPPPCRGGCWGPPAASPLRSPFSLGSADEELGAVRVGASVGHGQDARARVLQDEVLIGELLPIDGFAASAVVAREVATLKKKSGISGPQRRRRLSNRAQRPCRGCRQEAEPPSHPKSAGTQHQHPRKRQLSSPAHLPAAAGAPHTWHMNPGMILWKQDPL